MTSDNLENPWLHFEAGALSRTPDAQVWTVLLDLTHADVKQPLGQFQHTLAARDDMLSLARAINSAVKGIGGRALSDPDLERMFGLLWPDLETALEKATATPTSNEPSGRKDRDLLEEMLAILRDQSRERDATRFFPPFLDENSFYAVHNGSLRPVQQIWMRQNGEWQPVNIQQPALGSPHYGMGNFAATVWAPGPGDFETLAGGVGVQGERTGTVRVKPEGSS